MRNPLQEPQAARAGVQMSTGIVLLHGAGLGGWIWEPVLPHLRTPAVVIDLQGSQDLKGRRVSLAECAEHVMGKLDGLEQVVLVGHSVSGGLALLVASQLGERAVGVVMVGAGVPSSGLAYTSLLPAIQRWMTRGLFTLFPSGMKAPAKVLRQALCADLDDALAEQVVERIGVAIPRLFLDRVHWSLSAPVVLRYVVLTKDVSDLSPALQRRCAATLGGDVVELATGHLPMFTEPARLAEVLEEVVVNAARGPAEVP